MSAGTNGLQRHAGRAISFPACYVAAAAGDARFVVTIEQLVREFAFSSLVREFEGG